MRVAQPLDPNAQMVIAAVNELVRHLRGTANHLAEVVRCVNKRLARLEREEAAGS